MSHRTRVLALGLVVLFVFLFLLAHLRIHTTLNDDAYITYRYSANVAHGNGLVYNPGQHVLGTTTPAYALLLGGIARVLGADQIPTIALTINALAMLIAAAGAAWIVFGLSHSDLAVSLIVGLTLLNPFTLYASLAGMESPVFLALLSLILVTLAQKRWFTAACLLGMLPLVRPEGLLVLAIIGLYLAFNHLVNWQTWAKAAVIAALPTILWIIAATSYYGSPVPQSIEAKTHGLYPLSIGTSTAGTVLPILRSIVGIAPLQAPLLYLLAVIMMIYLLIIGCFYLIRAPFPYNMLPLLTLGLLGFYSTSKTIVFEHYIAHLELLVKICLGAGFYKLSSSLLQKRANQIAIAAAIGLLLFPIIYLYPIKTGEPGGLVQDSVKRQEHYRQVAQAVAPQLPEKTVILLPEIGELGYFLPDMVILDACGLVSPEAVKYLPIPDDQRAGANIGAIPPQMVHDYQPDLVITLEVFGRNGMLADPWFQENYTPVITQTGSWLPWESKALYVFSRNDFAPGLALAGS